MCDPATMTAATLAKLQMATTVASTLMSLTAQKNAAKAQGAALRLLLDVRMHVTNVKLQQ